MRKRTRLGSGSLALLCALALLLIVPPGAAASAGRHVAADPPKPPEPTEDSPGAEPYRPIVDQAVADIASRMGELPIPPPFIDVAKKGTKDPKTLAEAFTYGDNAEKCLIRIYPNGQKGPEVDLRFVVVHEVFHCFGSALGGHNLQWVAEGAAMWAAADIVTGSDISAQWWDAYLETPGKSMYGRAHDALGFFGHLEDVGLDPWPVLLPMLQAKTDVAAFGVAEAAGGPPVVDEWASGLAREPAFGAAWETGGADITSTKPPRVHAKIDNGAAFGQAIPAAANLIAELDLSADVVMVVGAGANGRLRDSEGLDRPVQELNAIPLCTRDDGCACPQGSVGQGIPFDQIAPGAALLGASGGSLAASVAVEGKSVEEFCKKPGKVDPCLVGTWVSETISLAVPGVTGATGGAGAVLTLKKNGTGTTDFGPMQPFSVTLPGGLAGTVALTGKASGVVSALDGVITSLTTSSSGFAIAIDVPGLGKTEVPGGALGPGGPLDGTYECTKKTLTYDFGFPSTWART